MRSNISLLSLCLCLFYVKHAAAQFNNSWIQYDQVYLEVLIDQDGLYEIAVTEIENAGLDISKGIDQLQVFHRGKQIPIHIQGETIFFYGLQNRGDFDKVLYKEDEQLNPSFSLFTDQSAYYLTINNDQEGLRYTMNPSTASEEIDEVRSVWLNESAVLRDTHFKPKVGVNQDLQSSAFDIGEGFGSELSNDHRFIVRANGIQNSSAVGTLNIRLAGNNTDHKIQILWNDVLLEEFSTSGYGVHQKQYPIEATEILQTNKLSIRGLNGDLDKLIIASYSLEYPHLVKQTEDQQTIFLNPSVVDQSLLVNTNSEIFIVDQAAQTIYNPKGETFITVKAVLEKTKLNYIPKADIPKIRELHKVEFTDFTTQNPSYILLTDYRLRESNATGQDEVEAYAAYRGSSEGGGYDVLIVDVNDLYRQFSYGIQSHPIATKQFAQYAADIWPDIEGLFIIGKGHDYYTTRFEDQKLKNIEFVPTYGSPGSDNLLISDNGSIAPLFPVGRLAAQSPSDIRLYLDKIIAHEQQDPSQVDPLWRKRVLHLSGGSSDIVDAVAFFLEDLEELIEQSAIGAEVETFKKTSAAPIQPAQTKDLLRRINEGVSMITFLGHSSPGTFDFSLEEPGAYDNDGQLPLIVSLGCHSGNIHSEGFGLSEQFVLEPEKGAIAFLASSSSNYLDTQYLTGRILYLLIGDGFYEQSIGRSLQEVLILTDRLDQGALALNEQFTLHGDPLLRFEYSSFPDLQVDESTAATDPIIVTTTVDSFDFNVNIINAGRVIQDSVIISIKHISSNDSILYQTTQKIAVPSFSSEFTVRIPSPGLSSLGNNKIDVEIDPDNLIVEGPDTFGENNNSYISESGVKDYRFTILDDAIKAVFPYDFSIVNTNIVKIKASTSNAFAELETYRLQMDTTVLFSSPLLKEETQTAVGLLQWEFELTNEETVYYWRVFKEGQNPNASQNQSFLFSSKNLSGWNQSHYFQHQQNEYTGIVLKENRELQFDTSGFFISIHNRIYNPAVPPGYQFNFENFAASVNPWLFMEEGIAIVVGDEINGSALLNEGGGFGSVFNQTESSTRVFGFSTQTSDSREDMINFLDDIPDGQYVFLFTVIGNETTNLNADMWLQDSDIYGKNIIDYLENEGATMIRDFSSGETLPYNFIYQKNRKVLGENIATTIDESIRTDVFIPRLVVSGAIESTVIGPASRWATVELDLQTEQSDDFELSIIGIDNNGIETLLSIDSSMQIDISNIAASQYPYLKLRLKEVDEENRTAAQINHWRVLYDELPDLALDPMFYSTLTDTLSLIDEFKIGIGVTNTSLTAIDETTINYILSTNTEAVDTIEQTIPALLGEASIRDSIILDRNSLTDGTILKIQVNPNQNILEKHYFNNIALTDIGAQSDNQSPTLSVFFDGIEIEDGSIVSPAPFIVFQVFDNRLKPVSELSQFEITIRDPDGTIWNIIDNEELLALKNAEDNQSSSLEFRPIFESGDYELTAKVFDASANQSLEYKVIFKVVKTKSISDIKIFPNPLTDGSQFSYFLTGDSRFTIDIYSARGKRVKQFTASDLNNLSSGQNETDQWNGTDDAGNMLPNGVYTFKIVYDESDPSYTEFIQPETAKSFGQFVILR